MAAYTSIFWCFLALCCSVTYRSSDYCKNKIKNASDDGNDNDNDELSAEQKHAHNKLLKKYLFVYLLATLSDWLQGPYVYALYSEYGFSQHENARLFVAGFASSMIVGTFIGGIADQAGRRLFVMLYAAVYLASCLTKHFKDYYVLMIGRLLGGVATSLLFSIFEAWLIKAHADADLPKQCLPKSFSWAAFGNSAIAILAGLVANHIANSAPMVQVSGNIYRGGYLNPFDLAILVLILCGAGAYFLWEENYGSHPDDNNNNNSNGKNNLDLTQNTVGKGHKVAWYTGLVNAVNTTLHNRDILLCGIISSLFEGSMYIFVFMWTPLLKDLAAKANQSTELPFGLIFATFMVCCMTGSSIFGIYVEKFPIERLGVFVFGVGAVAMAIVALEINDTLCFIGMNVFEMCVGMYFPIMGTMKGGIVPEDKRAAIYNIYRAPLNFIVLMSLLVDLAPKVAFMFNACMLGTATVLQGILAKRRLCSGQMVGPSGRKNQELSQSNQSTTPQTLTDPLVDNAV